MRVLEPWFENVGKRLVKSPKVYVRDSGLLHALLGIMDRQALEGHPKVVRNKRIGIEIKRADAPTITPSMQSALGDLKLERLLVIYPGAARYALSKQTAVLPLVDAIASLSELR